VFPYERKTPQALKRLRGNDLGLLPWVELNYRAHAYQATERE